MTTGQDRRDLKIQALLERISELVAQYENQDSERRIQITELSQENSNLRQQLEQVAQERSEQEVTQPAPE